MDALDPDKSVYIGMVVDVNALRARGGGLVQLEGTAGYEPNQVRIWWEEGGQEIDVNLAHTWDLSDPNTFVPTVMHADFIAPVGTRQDLTLDLLYGREPNSLMSMDQLTLTQVQVQMYPVLSDPLWEGNCNLVPDVAKPVQLDITPMPTHGYFLLDVNDGNGYVHVWEDQARTVPIPLPMRWDLPGEYPPSVIYVEGVAGGENMHVTLKLAFHENPEIASCCTVFHGLGLAVCAESVSSESIAMDGSMAPIRPITSGTLVVPLNNDNDDGDSVTDDRHDGWNENGIIVFFPGDDDDLNPCEDDFRPFTLNLRGIQTTPETRIRFSYPSNILVSMSDGWWLGGLWYRCHSSVANAPADWLGEAVFYICPGWVPPTWPPEWAGSIYGPGIVPSDAGAFKADWAGVGLWYGYLVPSPILGTSWYVGPDPGDGSVHYYTTDEATFYVEGIEPGSGTILIWIDLTNDNVVDYEFAIPVIVGPGVAIDDIILPNNFIALPDDESLHRFAIPDAPDPTHTAKTDMRIVYTNYLPSGGPFVYEKVIISSPGFGSLPLEFDLQEKGNGTFVQDLTIELDLTYAYLPNVLIEENVTLEAQCDSPSCTYYDTRKVNTMTLVANVEFSPPAYQDQGYVCPYTHYHGPISGDNLAHAWYGLLMTYMVSPECTLDDLTVRVSGGDMGGIKALALPPGALLGDGASGSNHKVKWEGYDNSITEPAELPFCVFPQDVTVQPAPEYVVKEGLYLCEIEAKDSRSVTEPTAVLQQSYKIEGIPIHVMYNMTD